MYTFFNIQITLHLLYFSVYYLLQLQRKFYINLHFLLLKVILILNCFENIKKILPKLFFKRYKIFLYYSYASTLSNTFYHTLNSVYTQEIAVAENRMSSENLLFQNCSIYPWKFDFLPCYWFHVLYSFDVLYFGNKRVSLVFLTFVLDNIEKMYAERLRYLLNGFIYIRTPRWSASIVPPNNCTAELEQ